jgi:hypothetical protein
MGEARVLWGGKPLRFCGRLVELVTWWVGYGSGSSG